MLIEMIAKIRKRGKKVLRTAVSQTASTPMKILLTQSLLILLTITHQKQRTPSPRVTEPVIAERPALRWCVHAIPATPANPIKATKRKSEPSIRKLICLDRNSRETNMRV